MSIHVMNLVWKNAPCQGNTLLALLALADWSDDNGKSWPAVETLAKKSRQSERNCRTVIRSLEDLKLVTVTERKGESSLFEINLKLLEGQSLPPAKISKRGGDRRKSLPKNAEMFAPNTSIEPSIKIDTSTTPFLFEDNNHISFKPKKLSIQQALEKTPSWIPAEPMAGFLEMRELKKIPLTERALDGIVDDLKKLTGLISNLASLILDQSTKRGWTGVFKLIEDKSLNEIVNGRGFIEPSNSLLDTERQREENYRSRQCNRQCK